MSVSYEYYKIFYYAAKYRSFNKAANALMNSQPNITRTINNLESLLGVKLFDRQHTGVTLTPEGEVLYKHVQAAHRHFEIAEDAIESIRELKTGSVTIGFSIGITDQMINDQVLPALRSFHEDYPDLHLQIFNNSSPQLVQDVADGVLDLAVVTTTEEHSRDVKEHILYSFRDTVIAGKAYRKLISKPLTLEELTGYPIVSLWHETETYDLYSSFFAEHGYKFYPAVETATAAQVLSFVESNMGIGFIHPDSARESIDSKQVYELKLEDGLPERRISLIYNGSLQKGSAAYILKGYFGEE